MKVMKLSAIFVVICLLFSCDNPFQMFGTVSPRTVSGPNLALYKTISASSVQQTYYANYANDGNTTTYWEGAPYTYPNTLTVDLGTSTGVDSVVLKLNPATIWSTRTQTLSLLGSTNNSDFSTIVAATTYTFNPSISGNAVTISFAAGSYRYLRLNITANSGATSGQIAEFEVYGPSASPSPQPSPISGTNYTLGKSIWANGYTQTYTANYANDGNVDTYWEGAANAYPNTLTVDLGTATSVSTVILKLNPATIWSTRTQTLSLLGSVDNSAYSAIVASSTYAFNPSTNSNAVTISFTAESYRYLCLSITANSGAPGGQIAEFEVYGPSTPPTIEAPFGGINWPINNGAIIQAEDYNLGGEGLAYHDADTVNEGGAYRTDGVDLEACGDTGGGYDIGWTADGEYVQYTTDVEAGRYNIIARLSSAVATPGSLRISLDGVNLGTIAVLSTGAWQSYQDQTIYNADLIGGSGKILRLDIGGGFNINYIKFETANSTSKSALDYLKSISGSKTVIGIHNREPNYAPAMQTIQAFNVTGRWPGLWSGDFLFSASDVSNRWTMINEALNQWKNGAIINIMMHVVPPTQVEPGVWNGGVISALNDAQWWDLITPNGTLNKAWKARLDMYAEYLQFLKDNGAQVLFRPFHEMNQSAFWWGGRPGSNGTAALYRLTKDYLVEVKGLTNLIWVWNMQDLDLNWSVYNPGNNYWDIFSVDIYGGDGYTAAKYNTAVSVAGGKPIAIGECAVLPTSSLLSSQPKWVFCMSWAELTFSSNTTAQIQVLYGATNVLTRDELPKFF